MPERLLILGGTAEAAALAIAAVAAFPDLAVISSVAGRTAGAGAGLPGRVRVGGFGGAAGLAEYLRAGGIGLVVDATHPFATEISAHARQACAAVAVPRLRLERLPWTAETGDRWIAAATMADAAAMLPGLGRRAFLTVGRGGLAAFAGCRGLWMLARVVDASPPPFACDLTVARGPFSADDEAALLGRHRVDIVVTKASGGDDAKLVAARRLGLPVLMVRRPPPEPGDTATTVAAALAWIASVRLPANQR